MSLRGCFHAKHKYWRSKNGVACHQANGPVLCHNFPAPTLILRVAKCFPCAPEWHRGDGWRASLDKSSGGGAGGQEDTVVTYIAEDRDLTGVTDASGCASVHGR